MPSPPNRSTRLMSRAHLTLLTRSLPFLGAALATACGSSSSADRFAPPCPVPSIPRDTSDLRRFRGAGRDITDSVIEGRITGVGGSCKAGETGFTTATISVGMELSRGPAAPGRTADIAYYIAVSENERILDKRVYTLSAEFPPNAERLRLTGDEVDLNLPVTADKTAAAYRVSVGFQLTPEELQVNRSRPQR